MMMNLTKNEGIEEDDENMQNTLSSTSVVTLENINKLIGPNLEEINMEFMESKHPLPPACNSKTTSSPKFRVSS